MNLRRFFPLILALTLPAHAATLDIQAHRGGRALGPDNSLETFQRAIEMGVPTIELDVQGRDGKLFVAHEPEFSRGEVPQLDDVLALVAPTTTRVSIEVKAQRSTPEEAADVARQVAAALDARKLAERAIVQSFEPAALRAINSQRTDIQTSILVRPGDDFTKALDESNAFILSPRVDGLTKGKVELARARGVRVIPWVVNEEEEMRRVVSWGVDGIITDHPDVAMRLFGDTSDDDAGRGRTQFDPPAPTLPQPRSIANLADVRTLAVYPFTSGGNVDTFCTSLFVQKAHDEGLFDRIIDPVELPITTADGQPFSPRELMTYLREEAAARGADAFLIGEGKWYDWGFRMEFRVVAAADGRVLWQGAYASGLAFGGPSAKKELVGKAARGMKRSMESRRR